MQESLKILIVDDDCHITELISLYLNKEGYKTREIHTGKAAISEFSQMQPHLILLDLMLPEMDGYQVCAEIRKTSKTPIIMLTARGEVFDKVLGLELGADDYIVKPFDPKELVARVRAVLRRYGGGGNEDDSTAKKIEYPNLIINPVTYSVVYHTKTLELPPKEFELLLFLASSPNHVFTRDQLLNNIWGYEYFGDTRTVDVHIKRIREKFEFASKDSWGIKTVWGVGYKFDVSQ